jgi:hypothetical protein
MGTGVLSASIDSKLLLVSWRTVSLMMLTSASPPGRAVKGGGKSESTGGEMREMCVYCVV